MGTTLKFKVGDKVRVKSLEWYNYNKDANGLVYLDKQGIVFDETMTNLCGKIVQIEVANSTGYFAYGYSGFLQDWMLEDEVVNEEEVEQLNKNNMETEKKLMTKEEIFEFLKNTKIVCTSKEEAIKVQVTLLGLGIKWLSGREEIVEDRFLLFVNEKHKLQSTTNFAVWVEDYNKRIEPGEILSIQLKEDKPKFNTKTLQPFDKVLVRNTATDVWCARFFDRWCELGVYDTTSQESWIFCIPYNEETKHLHGTSQEEPEFYRI